MFKAILGRMRGNAVTIKTAGAPDWREILPGLVASDVRRKGAPRTLLEWNERQFKLAVLVSLFYEVDRLDVLPLVALEWPKHAPRTYAA